MPDLEANETVWERTWDWSTEGDEWSAWWGGTEVMWAVAIAPRLRAFLPAGVVLEIAPGHGRWTQYLAGLADELVLVDLSSRCIEHCRNRFRDSRHISYHVNDGRSLAMVEDGSIDFVVSIDSLVHAQPDIVEGYLAQLADKLAADGVGFIHHSNLGAYRAASTLARRLPKRVRYAACRRGWLPDVTAWRDESLTGSRFAEMCRDHGLVCIAQELVSWEHGRWLIDAFSVFTRPGSRWDRPAISDRNPAFAAEGRRMRTLWAPSSFG